MTVKMDAESTTKEFFEKLMEVMDECETDTIEGTLNLGSVDVDFELTVMNIRPQTSQGKTH